MTKFDLKHLNHEQVLEELQALPEHLQTKAIRSGLVSAAAPIKKQAKATAPVSDREGGGTLQKAIGHRLLTKRDVDRIDLFVSATKRTVFSNPGVSIIVGANRKVGGKSRGHIAAWLEHGLEAKRRTHRYTRRNKSQRRKKVLKPRSYRHSGMAADSFQARALASASPQIGERFYKGVARSLNRMR